MIEKMRKILDLGCGEDKLLNKKKIIPEYLMYYLYTLKPYYVQKSRGVAQNNINLTILKDVKIKVPKIDIQKEICSKINERNLDEIFQTSLSHKYKKEQIMGAKAIVYMASDGNYNVAFLTEAINTHHRHAAATLAKFIENKFLEESDKEKINKKADALYEGNSDKSCELLTQCAGFELQYDKNLKKIIGIQQDSWITKEQQRCSRKPSLQVEEDMIIELLTHIDQKLLSEKLKNLEEEDFKKLYSGKKVA